MRPHLTAANGHVRWSVGQRLAHVQLDRPDKLNALDADVFRDLLEAGTALSDQVDVAAVVLTGVGRAFCAGLDVAQFERMRAGGAVVIEEDRLGAARALAQKAVHIWSLLPVPVIAGVHGVAFGGGLQLALGADIRVVDGRAKLSMMEIKWGIAPDMGGTQLLPDLVGRDVAKDLIFTGRTVTGVEAGRIGLATRVSEDAVADALALGREIAEHSRAALVHAKRLVELSGRVPLAEGFDAEQDALADVLGSPEQLAIIEQRLKQRGRSSD